ncbi:MAG: aldehyde dehydrogenase family protein [Candidatus Thioglobus sp.]|nr:MAG: aldehyde dehydrogenase family protein [Candidatus Thioglobus sp.]KAA0456451.1 MAG: aldehyde dehydrogenase family protein [Candidatus Thioglobus sp.]
MSKLIVNQAYTQKPLAELNMNTTADVEKMLFTATKLHKQGCLPAYQRIQILQKLANLMQAEQDDLAKLIANEGGKPLKDAKVEVTRAIDGVGLAIAGIRSIKGYEVPMDLTEAGAGRLAFTTLEPIGVVVAVSAFNHPLNLIVHQVVPGIAAGCPVIVKPAEATPLCCLRFAELAVKAGLPEGWLQTALLDINNSQKLVTDARVGFFSFIGSARVGWMLKSKLAAGTRCSLEHGGVAPLIFDEYNDEQGFVNGVVKAGFYHGGQVCVSVQKVFVLNGRAADIAQKIAKAAGSLKVGDAIDADTDVGPLINTSEVDRVSSWVDEAIAEGATLITGGKKIGTACYQPTVLLNPAANSKVSTMEIFGPVVCVYAVDDISEAIDIANSLDVAFQAAVFSDNISVAMRTAKALNASAVMINDYTTFRTDWMPFAGRKHSGYGTGGIGHTMEDMLEHKMLVIKTD